MDMFHPFVDPTSIEIAAPPPAILRDDVNAMPTARPITTVIRPVVVVDPTPTVETPTQTQPVVSGYKSNEGQYGGATSEISPNLQTVTPAVINTVSSTVTPNKNYLLYAAIGLVIIAILVWYFKFKK